MFSVLLGLGDRLRGLVLMGLTHLDILDILVGGE